MATWRANATFALPARQAVQLVVGDAEDLYDRLLDRLARRSKGASATAEAMRAER